MCSGRARTKDSQQTSSEHKWKSVFASRSLHFWLLRMDATRLSDGIFDRLRRLQVAEEVLQRARRALCARCALAG